MQILKDEPLSEGQHRAARASCDRRRDQHQQACSRNPNAHEHTQNRRGRSREPRRKQPEETLTSNEAKRQKSTENGMNRLIVPAEPQTGLEPDTELQHQDSPLPADQAAALKPDREDTDADPLGPCRSGRGSQSPSPSQRGSSPAVYVARSPSFSCPLTPVNHSDSLPAHSPHNDSPTSPAYKRSSPEAHSPTTPVYRARSPSFPCPPAPRGLSEFPGYSPTWPSYSPSYSPSTPCYSRGYSPTSPAYLPTSQAYSPTSPAYSPPSLSYMPTRRPSSPPSRANSPLSRAYSPPSRAYSPTSRAFSPTSPAYLPTSRPYSPPHGADSPPHRANSLLPAEYPWFQVEGPCRASHRASSSYVTYDPSYERQSHRYEVDRYVSPTDFPYPNCCGPSSKSDGPAEPVNTPEESAMPHTESSGDESSKDQHKSCPSSPESGPRRSEPAGNEERIEDTDATHHTDSTQVVEDSVSKIQRGEDQKAGIHMERVQSPVKDSTPQKEPLQRPSSGRGRGRGLRSTQSRGGRNAHRGQVRGQVWTQQPESQPKPATHKPQKHAPISTQRHRLRQDSPKEDEWKHKEEELQPNNEDLRPKDSQSKPPKKKLQSRGREQQKGQGGGKFDRAEEPSHTPEECTSPARRQTPPQSLHRSQHRKSLSPLLHGKDPVKQSSIPKRSSPHRQHSILPATDQIKQQKPGHTPEHQRLQGPENRRKASNQLPKTEDPQSEIGPVKVHIETHAPVSVRPQSPADTEVGPITHFSHPHTSGNEDDRSEPPQKPQVCHDRTASVHSRLGSRNPCAEVISRNSICFASRHNSYASVCANLEFTECAASAMS